MADPDQVAALVDGAAADFGQIDVLVNDAGVSGGSHRLHELDIDSWDRTIAVNLRGTFLCARAAIPHLVRRPRSAMINIASTYGLIGAPLAPSYCASKGAIVTLTRQLAVDYSRDGLRVNAICPGYTDTDMGGPEGSPAAGRARRRPGPAGSQRRPAAHRPPGAAPGSGPRRHVPGLGRGVLHDRLDRDRRRRVHGHLPVRIMMRHRSG